jgi:predicted nuclease with RNAse H fold
MVPESEVDERPPVTIGIDLASKPAKTAMCAITWRGDYAVADFDSDTSDAHIVDVIESAAKVGLDCPLGWPEPFVRAINAHSQMGPWPGHGVDPEQYRRTLAYRETDRVVQESGRPPLSVSTDRIGIVAMRFAGIADALARRDHPVDRSGKGLLAEVYPAAALRAWGLPDRGYKGKGQEDGVAALADALMERIPWLSFADGAQARCRTSHDALDAFICALVARAVALGRTSWPDSVERWRLAEIEGWIHVPVGEPAELG